jgi:hypothetical protein
VKRLQKAIADLKELRATHIEAKHRVAIDVGIEHIDARLIDIKGHGG